MLKCAPTFNELSLKYQSNFSLKKHFSLKNLLPQQMLGSFLSAFFLFFFFHIVHLHPILYFAVLFLFPLSLLDPYSYCDLYSSSHHSYFVQGLFLDFYFYPSVLYLCLDPCPFLCPYHCLCLCSPSHILSPAPCHGLSCLFLNPKSGIYIYIYLITNISTNRRHTAPAAPAIINHDTRILWPVHKKKSIKWLN